MMHVSFMSPAIHKLAGTGTSHVSGQGQRTMLPIAKPESFTQVSRAISLLQALALFSCIHCLVADGVSSQSQTKHLGPGSLQDP